MHKILVVEDEELIRTMLQINLENDDFDVITCESAERMLEKLNRHRFDLILLDIKLPGINGQEALELLRTRGIETPVIMVTAVENTSSKVSSLEHGADDYISKPFDLDELKARIKAVLRRENSKDPHIKNSKGVYNDVSKN